MDLEILLQNIREGYATHSEQVNSWWKDLRQVYLQQHQKTRVTFHEWVLGDDILGRHIVRSIVLLKCGAHYYNLKKTVQKLIEQLVRLFGLEGFWELYHFLDQYLLSSRKALQMFKQTIISQPLIRISELRTALEIASMNRDSACGRFVARFTLADSRAACQYLCSIQDEATIPSDSSAVVSTNQELPTMEVVNAVTKQGMVLPPCQQRNVY